MANPPAGDSAAVSNRRPRPECMADFLPLWNARNAHIEGAALAQAKLDTLRKDADGVAASIAEGKLSREFGAQFADRIRELSDTAEIHLAEAAKLTEQMQPLTFDA